MPLDIGNIEIRFFLKKFEESTPRDYKNSCDVPILQYRIKNSDSQEWLDAFGSEPFKEVPQITEKEYFEEARKGKCISLDVFRDTVFGYLKKQER